jgi:hypothetical protein
VLGLETSVGGIEGVPSLSIGIRLEVRVSGFTIIAHGFEGAGDRGWDIGGFMG